MKHEVLSKVLAYRDLEHKLLAIVVRLEGVQDRGQLVGIELHCFNCVSRIGVHGGCFALLHGN